MKTATTIALIAISLQQAKAVVSFDFDCLASSPLVTALLGNKFDNNNCNNNNGGGGGQLFSLALVDASTTSDYNTNTQRHQRRLEEVVANNNWPSYPFRNWASTSSARAPTLTPE